MAKTYIGNTNSLGSSTGNRTTTAIAVGLITGTLVMSVFSMYSVILVVFGLLPAFTAIIIDMEPRRYITRLVTSYNVLGTAPFVTNIIANYNDSRFAINVIVDPLTWIIIFSLASFGWIIYWFLPQCSIYVNNIKIRFKISELEEELSILSAEWGEEIRPTSAKY